MALTTLAKVKTFLKIADSDTSEDAFLTQMKDAVEAALKRLLKREIESASRTAYLCGNWTRTLRLPEYPVSAVTDVRIDPSGYYGQGPDSFGSETQLTAGVDYALRMDAPDGLSSRSGLLDRIGTVWTGDVERPPGRLSSQRVPGKGNVKVTYTAGYATIPDDLQAVVWQAVGQMRASTPAGAMLVSEGYDGYNYTLEQADQALSRVGSVAQVIARYGRKDTIIG